MKKKPAHHYNPITTNVPALFLCSLSANRKLQFDHRGGQKRLNKKPRATAWEAYIFWLRVQSYKRDSNS